MNFTSEIRRELLRTPPGPSCCQAALLAGFLRTSGTDTGERVFFTCEEEEVAEYMLSVIEERLHIVMTLTEAIRDPINKRPRLTFSHAGGAWREIAELSCASLPDHCARAFLKGAFLGSGSCTLPRGGNATGYHLEVVFRGEEDAAGFVELLDGLQLLGSVAKRGEKRIVYCKSREGIGDYLSVLRAEGALRKLEAISAAREERNNENRVTNCMAGNFDKAAIASAHQVVTISAMRDAGKLFALPEPLKEAALARLEHPELSLAELAETLKISKSCLNHRLRRLMALGGKG